MQRLKADRSVLLLSGVFITVALLTLLWLMNSATTVIAPTTVAQITPTGPRPNCGTVARKSSTAGQGFPVVSVSNCPPDTTRLTRKPLLMRQQSGLLPGVVVGAPKCENWYVYHSNETGNWEIYRMDAAGGGILNLSRGGPDTDNLSPAFSPDRATIAFTSNRDGNWEVYVANTDGSGDPQRITYNSFAVDMNPIWSPDGKHLLYESVRNGNWDLYMFDVTNPDGDEVQLTNNPASDQFPSWSPDGSKLAFQSNRDGKWQLYELTLADKAVKSLSNGSAMDFNPTYSPEGKQISFLSTPQEGAIPMVYVMNSDGSARTPVSPDSVSAANQSWSPNGSLLAYEATVNGTPGVYVYEFQDQKTRSVTDAATASYAPTWDCNSSTLVFTANTPGNPNLFSASVLPIDRAPIKVDSAATRLTTGKAAYQFAVGTPRDERASKQSMAQSPSAKAGPAS